MGDRANIVLDMPCGYADEAAEAATKKQSANKPIYLYTHWSGSELPEILQRALGRRQRWNDDAYLARIIFSELTRGHERDETGFGISLRPCDNSYPYLRVDSDKQTVTVDFDPMRKYNNKSTNRTFTFDEYVALPDIGWDVIGLKREED